MVQAQGAATTAIRRVSLRSRNAAHVPTPPLGRRELQLIGAVVVRARSSYLEFSSLTDHEAAESQRRCFRAGYRRYVLV